jgi:sugar/nucleoside kinase (ribokinase family)
LPGLRGAGIESILRIAKQSGVITLLDIGPAIGKPAHLDEVVSLLPLVDYLVTNEHELAVCTDEVDIQAGVDALLKAQANCVIVKQGAKGALAVTRNNDIIHADSFPVNATVTVGAGDSFNAGLMFGLERELPFKDALHMANATAALVVQAGKSVFGAPTLQQVETFSGQAT